MNTNRLSLVTVIVLELALAAHFSGCSKAPEKSDAPAAPASPQPVTQPPAPVEPAKPSKPSPKNPQPKPAPKKPEPKKPQPKPQPKPEPKPQPKPQPKPAPKPEPGKPLPLPPLDQNVGTPAWGGRQAWTGVVRQVVAARFGDFERARDKEVFCPGYSNASPAERVNCFVLIVAGVSKFESNFHTSDAFREPDGHYSIGLLALSPDECPNARTHKALGDPLQNLICGTNMMAKLIARDGYIDGPDGHRGAASYWSTLRSPYKRWDPSRKRYLNLGYKTHILPLVRNYRARAHRTGLVMNEIEFTDAMDAEVVVDRDELDVEHGQPNDDRDFFEPR